MMIILDLGDQNIRLSLIPFVRYLQKEVRLVPRDMTHNAFTLCVDPIKGDDKVSVPKLFANIIPHNINDLKYDTFPHCCVDCIVIC